MEDQLDVHLTDDELLAEIALVTNLIVAATASDQPLAQERIDVLLGVGPPQVPSQRHPHPDH